MRVVGVDGCRGGWVAVVWDIDDSTWHAGFHATFADILCAYHDAGAISVDIPIGLRDDAHPRRCDVEARALLGRPRGSSVFPAPQRSLLACSDYADASARSRERFGKGISRQAFGIYDKVREVDALVTPAMQHRVVEVHPEVVFRAMNGGEPIICSKKKPDGFDIRQNLLADNLAHDVPTTQADARRLAPGAGADDLLDACAAAWTARRIVRGEAVRIPEIPDIDDRSLRMEIVY